MRKLNFFDVIIVGGGPAGLSAALMLGRACRTVLLCDAYQASNRASKILHDFIALDGMKFQDLVQKARQQLSALGTVTFWDDEVKSGHRWQNEFEIMMKDGRTASSRKLLLATGMMDEVPPIPGAADFFGTSVFQCPYCDGWEIRGKPVAVYGRGQRGFNMVRTLFGWTRDLVLCTDGPSGLLMQQEEMLGAHGIAIKEEPVECLEGEDGFLEAIRFRNGESLPRNYLFFNPTSLQKSSLAESLGCECSENGVVKIGQYASTSVPGLHVAGNLVDDMRLAVLAAAEGAQAALGISMALAKENFASWDVPLE